MNQITVSGNVGTEPELYQGDGWQSGTLNLATEEKWKNKAGETESETTWHKVKATGSIVNVIMQYVKKGDQIAIVGKAKNRSYQRSDGSNAYEYFVALKDLQLLRGSKMNG